VHKQKITITLSPVVVTRLREIGGGPRKIGAAIEQILTERDNALAELERVAEKIEELRGEI
jgi:hypothetical protein